MPLYANARAFLEAVHARYRSLRGYSDTGLSRSVGRRFPNVCTFETKFLQPNRFRFSFEKAHPSPRRRHLISRCVVGHDGATPYFHWRHYSGPPQLEHPESFSLAIAGATGISSGTAHTIGALLFEDVGGFTLLDLKRVRFRRNRIVLGVPCVCVSGLHPRGGRYTAWFGEQDLFLRRLYRKTKFKSEELRFNPSESSSFDLETFSAPTIEI
jgi:hypothetical protein